MQHFSSNPRPGVWALATLSMVALSIVAASVSACLTITWVGLRAAARRQAKHLRDEEEREEGKAILPATMRRW
jgi:hypothetical protein